jgi:sugar O-acyltransferase (sialic acid O-acetyltransferase NeuD family)
MIIFGASGHGKVVASALENIQFYFDDNENIEVFLGKQVHAYAPGNLPTQEVVIAIGNNTIRKKLVEIIQHPYGVVIASSSEVDSSVSIGEGSQVLHGAIIQSTSKIGKHTIINTGASVDHDCTIADFCHIAPQVTLCGNITVGEGTFIGAGATVIPGIKIGKWCTIGAGSVVIKDIPDGATAVGNPAKIIKIND